MSGDFHILAQLAQRLSEMATPAFAQPLLTRCANAVAGLLANEFNTESSPYGNAWAPLKKPNKSGRILQGRTFRLIRSFRVPTTRTGFRIVTSVPYAQFHQYGTKNMPARPLVPEQSSGGMPEAWGNALNREFESYVTAWMAR